jgi:peptidoglycan/LPS O-acetylase OafA/YrhL
MDATQQPQPTGAEAAAALAEVRRRQGQVIKTMLVPVWYWWAMAAGMIAIGAARDSHDTIAVATTIPLAVLVMAGLTGAMIPQVRRRVRVHGAMQPGPRGVAVTVGLIVAVNVVTIAVAASLSATRVPHPLTIGYAAGAAVLVIAGPLANRYLRGLMLSKARQQTGAAPHAGGTA